MTTERSVTHDEEKNIYTLETSRVGTKKTVRSFRRFLGAVAWGDPKGQEPALKNHGALLGGETTDGELHILDEFQGSYFPIGAEPYLLQRLIEWKDRYMVQNYYVEREPLAHVRGLRDVTVNPFCDGLTDYAVQGHDLLGKPLYLNSPQHWPTFRDRTTVAHIMPISAAVAGDFDGSVNRVASLIARDDVSLGRSSCPVTRKWAKEPPKDAYNYPLFRALIWLVATWDRQKENTIVYANSKTVGKGWVW